MRGDQPVFIITGRKEDVYLAKKEILSAAEHFSQIRAGTTVARLVSSRIHPIFLSFSSSSQTTNEHEQLIE